MGTVTSPPKYCRGRSCCNVPPAPLTAGQRQWVLSAMQPLRRVSRETWALRCAPEQDGPHAGAVVASAGDGQGLCGRHIHTQHGRAQGSALGERARRDEERRR